MKSYKVIRTNPEISTVTVLLDIDGRTLQQDIAIADFGELTADSLTDLITPILSKFEHDLSVADDRLVDPPQEIEDLVGQSVEVS